MLKEYLISLEWNVLIGFLFQYSIKKFLTRIWIRYRYTDIKRPGSRTKKLTKRHPRNKINSTKKHFPPRRDEPEVRGERSGERWVLFSDILLCRGVVWRGYPYYVRLIFRTKLVITPAVTSLIHETTSFSRSLPKGGGSPKWGKNSLHFWTN